MVRLFILIFETYYNNSCFFIGSVSRAATQPNGIAVLGILYKWSFFPTYSPHINLARKVHISGSSYTETQKIFPLKDLIPSDTVRVFGYEGLMIFE